MTSFWEALDNTAKIEPKFGRERQQRFEEARAKAKSFHGRMLSGASRLTDLGIEVKLKDQTVSFRRGDLETLVVIFGSNDGTESRIFSPVIEYLKLTPSFQDLSIDRDIDAAAGEWLGRSIDVLEKNRDKFLALGFN